MKYPVTAYAQSLSELLLEAPSLSLREKIVENFYEFLKRNGDSVKIRDIVKVVEKKIREKKGETKVLVESADELSKADVDKIRKAFSGEIVFESKKDENFLAGERITINDEILVDVTARKEIVRFLSKNK